MASTLAVFNASAKPQMLNMNLGADGIVWKKTVTIQPYELFTQKIKDIIDSVNADPSTKSKVRALQGEISWFTPDQADVFGRVLIADVGGTRRKLQSYSCGNNIVLCGVSVSPSAISFDIGTDTAFGANLSFCTSYSPTTCSGGSYGGGSATYSWTSTNASLTPIVGSSSSYSAELYGQGVGTGGASVYVSAGSCGMGGSGQATVLGPDHVAVIVDNGGFPSDCPTTGIYVRQMQMQVVDTNGTPIGTIFSTKEAFSPNNILNTCGNGLPVPSSCAAEDAGGSFIDTMMSLEIFARVGSNSRVDVAIVLHRRGQCVVTDSPIISGPLREPR